MTMLTGLQPGYAKFCCFLCLWDSRARAEHYVRKHWAARDEIKQGKHNIKQKPLLQSDKIHLPPFANQTRFAQAFCENPRPEFLCIYISC